MQTQGGKSVIQLCYVGACVNGTPLSRMMADEKGSTWSIVKRFQRALGGQHPPRCFEIRPLRVEIKSNLQPIDLWDTRPDLWCIEQALVACNTAGLNSAFGGRFVMWKLDGKCDCWAVDVVAH
jgi:hypothetical protein